VVDITVHLSLEKGDQGDSLGTPRRGRGDPDCLLLEDRTEWHPQYSECLLKGHQTIVDQDMARVTRNLGLLDLKGEGHRIKTESTTFLLLPVKIIVTGLVLVTGGLLALGQALPETMVPLEADLQDMGLQDRTIEHQKIIPQNSSLIQDITPLQGIGLQV